MIRAILSGGRQCLSGIKLINPQITPSTTSLFNKTLPKCFSSLYQPLFPSRGLITLPIQSDPLLISKTLPNTITQTRTYIKYSRRKGKKKTDKSIVRRFFRLSWGMWIRRLAGCHRKIWKKSSNRKRRLRQHVMTSSTQSRRLDRMVTPYWTRRRYYIEDPYEPYHTREEYPTTRTKPRDLPY